MKKNNINTFRVLISADEDAKWQQLVENHHELCNLEKCCGKQINGLYYANIPGHQYSQYLRHRRRQSAYKTKPCRNHFGNGYCRAGELCPFYHSAEEKRNSPPPDFLVDSSSSSNSHNLNTIANFPIDYFGRKQPSQNYYYQQQQRKEEHHKHAMLDKLINDAQNIDLQMSKFLMTNREYFPPEETSLYQQQQYQVPRNNSYSAAGLQQQQFFSGDDENCFPADYRRQFMGASYYYNNQHQQQDYKPHSFNLFGGIGGGFSCAVGGDICSSQAAQLRSAVTNGMGMMKKDNKQHGAVSANNNAMMLMMGGGGMGGSFSKSFHPFSESYPLKNLLKDLLPNSGYGDHDDKDCHNINTEIVDSCGPSCG